MILHRQPKQIALHADKPKSYQCHIDDVELEISTQKMKWDM